MSASSRATSRAHQGMPYDSLHCLRVCASRPCRLVPLIIIYFLHLLVWMGASASETCHAYSRTYIKLRGCITHPYMVYVCDCSTVSEVVVPVVCNHSAMLLAVLDIDSDHPAAFDEVSASRCLAICSCRWWLSCSGWHSFITTGRVPMLSDKCVSPPCSHAKHYLRTKVHFMPSCR